MSLSLEHLDSCVPVTGLKAVQYGSLSLLLQGHGPFASVINTQNGQLLCKTRVFRRNNIHGFMIDESRRQQQHDKAENIDVLVWGGQSLRVLSLSSSHDSQATITLAHETAEYVAPDWIYDICASHVQDTQSLAYGITGHNSLLSVHLVDTQQRDSSKYPRGIRLKRVAAGVKSTLYSANVVALSPSHILMAAGTVFGEIIVWSCFLEAKPNVTFAIHHFFTGHDGSVFGVNISEEIIIHSTNKQETSKRLLASCSDDRTVRIWDISDCFDITSADASAYQTDDGFALRSTGFGSTAPVNIAGGSEIAVAKEWGHVSRIWGVYFLPVKNKSSNVVNLISRGEDATCQLWRLDLKPQSGYQTRYDLRNLSVLSHHVGKQIWSLCLAAKEQQGETIAVYTGGGDGGVRVFELDYFGDSPDHSHSLYSSRTMVKFANSRTNNDNLLRSFAFVSRDSLITVSDSGAVQVGKVEYFPSSCGKPQITWQDVALEEDLRSVTSIATLPRRGIALIGSSSSRAIRLYDHQTQKLTDVTNVPLRPVRILVVDLADSVNFPRGGFCFVVCYMKTDYVDLFYVENENDQPRRVRVSIPVSFEATVATAFCYDKYLALGGKGGGLMVYNLDFQADILEYIFCDYREKEKNILRCILPINDPEDPQTGYILTGGQNGTFSVHRLRQQIRNKTAEIRLVHQAIAPFPHVEGAYFDAQTGHLMLTCGKGGSFVIWDETTQTQVMVLECGGARRILDFMPGLFDGGIFAWNQQRALHVLVADSAPCRRPPLRIGSHGRELKSVAVGYYRSSNNTKIPYIASGGEDTAIRISVPAFSAESKHEWTPLRCLRVMTHHITGLQQVQWSGDGRFLFSSGGREEFFVWRVRRSVPRLGLAVLREGLCPRESLELELRIMSFDVLRLNATTAGEEEEEEQVERFLVALVYSNSTVKVFLYTSSSGRGTFDLLLQGTYSSNCLTEVHFIEIGSARYLVTGATDGYIAFWPLPSIAALIDSHSHSHSHSRDEAAAIEWTIHHAIHTSSIKSLEITQISETCQLLIGGGDDNSLSITTVRFAHSNPVINTVRVPNAHASAITATKVLDVRGHNNESGSIVVDLASSGNDQRVKLWRVTVGSSSSSSSSSTKEIISVSLDVNWYCAVADVAAMDVMEMPAASGNNSEGERVLVVAGVGMEMLRLVHVRRAQ